MSPPCTCSYTTRCALAWHIRDTWALMPALSRDELSSQLYHLDTFLALHLHQAGVGYVRRGNLTVPPWTVGQFPDPRQPAGMLLVCPYPACTTTARSA